jgi:two-component system nitrate/nitrite response regulator NarL
MPIGHASSIKVHLVALPLMRWGLERLLQTAHPQFEVVSSAASVTESLPLLARQPADVVVLDIDGGDGAEGVAELNAQNRARMLVLTASADVALLDRIVLAGVRGVVKKCDPPQILLKAIEKVHEGELWIDRGAAGRIFLEMARQKAAQRNDPQKSKIATLTSRERQTIAAVAGDASAPGKVIASRLCISEHTLRNHLTSIYSKLGLSSRLDLYAFATKHSLDKAV